MYVIHGYAIAIKHRPEMEPQGKLQKKVLVDQTFNWMWGLAGSACKDREIWKVAALIGYNANSCSECIYDTNKLKMHT